MGYLLKEALKSFCGVNQWSYAVFWKAGLQNPKLLIWEECYYDPLPVISGIDASELALEEWEACWNSSGSNSSLFGIHEEDKVHILVNQMMLDNQIKIVGEGLVGRAAFTGQHLWIIGENFTREAFHPPQVLCEMHRQMAAGMKTIAVIPIPDCGVVQLGSTLNISENFEFVNGVKTLLVQLGCVSSSVVFDNDSFPFAGNDSVCSSVSRAPSDLFEQNFVKYDGGLSVINENLDEILEPPSSGGGGGDDLFDILGSDFRKRMFNDGRRTLKTDDLHCSNSDLYSFDGGNSTSGVFSVNSCDNLLDAVVNNVWSSGSNKQISDDSLSCKTSITNGGLFGGGSCSFKSERTKEDAVVNNCSQASSSHFGSQISSLIGQSQSASTAYSKKQDEVCKSNRKRLKPGENPRPRPKDRQMIQDRMKELREIVPNGAKCSIDALLERTIKHMIFLQGVTKHADKLKQTGESKIIGNDGGLHLKDNFGGGRTWAYEVGSQSMMCPIIVEDLNAPRQMLVEMLCEERGLFLEIADIIRGLGLTILKGVMETRNDKIWARFSVEANRDVTRMEIFMSLVHLLEQTAATKNISSSTHGINCFEKNNDNLIAPVPPIGFR
ncbi:transcription factor LHW [Impatiens glandulifera]|uniref:transcription factor LHW n=1 Tax=Impatiens glandulifera TaxID=253017 RepID=UPI001FB1614B|nr:transcription factor LHW [Impatiens glandulifera]